MSVILKPISDFDQILDPVGTIHPGYIIAENFFIPEFWPPF